MVPFTANDDKQRPTNSISHERAEIAKLQSLLPGVAKGVADLTAQITEKTSTLKSVLEAKLSKTDESGPPAKKARSLRDVGGGGASTTNAVSLSAAAATSSHAPAQVPAQVPAPAPVSKKRKLSLTTNKGSAESQHVKVEDGVKPPIISLSTGSSATATITKLDNSRLAQHMTGLRFVSHVFSIVGTSATTFPVRLQIPHSATDEQLDRLVVVCCASDEEASDAPWEVLHKAVFSTGQAEIEVEHFSLYAIVMLATGLPYTAAEIAAGAAGVAASAMGAVEIALPGLRMMGEAAQQVAAIAGVVLALRPAVQQLRAFCVARGSAEQEAQPVAAPGVAPVAAAASAQARKWELLIFACSPNASPLDQASKEALFISAKLNGLNDSAQTDRPWSGHVHVYSEGGSFGGTPQALSQVLLQHRPRRFHFIGHGDAQLGQQQVLGFTSPTGGLQLVGHAAIAGMFMPVAGPDALRLVSLDACCTEQLGMAIHQAGVPVVVCWRTELEDTAGRIFGHAFYDACAQGCTERDAFDRAAQALRLITRSGTINNGQLAAHVPKYELRGPAEPANATGFAPLPFAAGVPVLICAEGTFLPRPAPP